MTSSGERWGLAGWWLSTWAIHGDSTLEVLATDENGRAAAWVRRYGGPSGTGFVQLGRSDWPADAIAQLAAVSEYRPH
ncbi:MAG: hypothetical protein ABI679_00450 [Gemmatimonadota bacterium]